MDVLVFDGFNGSGWLYGSIRPFLQSAITSYYIMQENLQTFGCFLAYDPLTAALFSDESLHVSLTLSDFYSSLCSLILRNTVTDIYIATVIIIIQSTWRKQLQGDSKCS